MIDKLSQVNFDEMSMPEKNEQIEELIIQKLFNDKKNKEEDDDNDEIEKKQQAHFHDDYFS